MNVFPLKGASDCFNDPADLTEVCYSPQLFATYSMVIWDTRSKVEKSALAKLSLYWPILMASSHSSTELKLEKSGMLRSRRGRWTLGKTRAKILISTDASTASSVSKSWYLHVKRLCFENYTTLLIQVSVKGLDLSKLKSWGHTPRRQRGHGLQHAGITDHLVQVVDDLAELGPVVAVLLPAVQHELVQRAGTVHGWGQPVVLLNGIDDLGGGT